MAGRQKERLAGFLQLKRVRPQETQGTLVYSLKNMRTFQSSTCDNNSLFCKVRHNLNIFRSRQDLDEDEKFLRNYLMNKEFDTDGKETEWV